MQPEHFFLVRFPQTAHPSLSEIKSRVTIVLSVVVFCPLQFIAIAIVEDHREPPPLPLPLPQSSSARKYLEAVFLSRWSNPKATTNKVTMNCNNQFRSTAAKSNIQNHGWILICYIYTRKIRLIRVFSFLLSECWRMLIMHPCISVCYRCRYPLLLPILFMITLWFRHKNLLKLLP